MSVSYYEQIIKLKMITDGLESSIFGAGHTCRVFVSSNTSTDQDSHGYCQVQSKQDKKIAALGLRGKIY